MNPPFIQLSKDELKYLIDLIHEIDSDTAYTARQRAYTLPKLQELHTGLSDYKLFYKDVYYLLELIDDDELDSPIKDQTYKTLNAILKMQKDRYDELTNIDEQRAKRRAKIRTKKTLL